MKQRESAFTLIELLVTVAIIGMLATLFSPAIGRVMEKAQSVKCASNLRGVGVAVHLYAQDHDNHFPKIEGLPSSPIYEGEEEAGTILEVLGPYGVSQAMLKCQSDLRRQNYFAKEGSSYMWRPLVDEELVTAPKIYSRRRGEIVPPASRLRLLCDYTRVHDGHVNCLMADGSVRLF